MGSVYYTVLPVQFWFTFTVPFVPRITRAHTRFTHTPHHHAFHTRILTHTHGWILHSRFTFTFAFVYLRFHVWFTRLPPLHTFTLTPYTHTHTTYYTTVACSGFTPLVYTAVTPHGLQFTHPAVHGSFLILPFWTRFTTHLFTRLFFASAFLGWFYCTHTRTAPYLHRTFTRLGSGYWFWFATAFPHTFTLRSHTTHTTVGYHCTLFYTVYWITPTAPRFLHTRVCTHSHYGSHTFTPYAPLDGFSHVHTGFRILPHTYGITFTHTVGLHTFTTSLPLRLRLVHGSRLPGWISPVGLHTVYHAHGSRFTLHGSRILHHRSHHVYTRTHHHTFGYTVYHRLRSFRHGLGSGFTFTRFTVTTTPHDCLHLTTGYYLVLYVYIWVHGLHRSHHTWIHTGSYIYTVLHVGPARLPAHHTRLGSRFLTAPHYVYGFGSCILFGSRFTFTLRFHAPVYVTHWVHRFTFTFTFYVHVHVLRLVHTWVLVLHCVNYTYTVHVGLHVFSHHTPTHFVTTAFYTRFYVGWISRLRFTTTLRSIYVAFSRFLHTLRSRLRSGYMHVSHVYLVPHNYKISAHTHGLRATSFTVLPTRFTVHTTPQLHHGSHTPHVYTHVGLPTPLISVRSRFVGYRFYRSAGSCSTVLRSFVHVPTGSFWFTGSSLWVLHHTVPTFDLVPWLRSLHYVGPTFTFGLRHTHGSLATVHVPTVLGSTRSTFTLRSVLLTPLRSHADPPHAHCTPGFTVHLFTRAVSAHYTHARITPATTRLDTHLFHRSAAHCCTFCHTTILHTAHVCPHAHLFWITFFSYRLPRAHSLLRFHLFSLFTLPFWMRFWITCLISARFYSWMDSWILVGWFSFALRYTGPWTGPRSLRLPRSTPVHGLRSHSRWISTFVCSTGWLDVPFVLGSPRSVILRFVYTPAFTEFTHLRSHFYCCHLGYTRLPAF